MPKTLLLFAFVVVTCFVKEEIVAKLFTKSEQKLFVDVNNKLRRIPNASDMNEVSWDDFLAVKAGKFADVCNETFEFEDSLPENTGITRYKLRSTKQELLVPLLSWYSRGYFYNFTYDLCNITKTCQYYTHVMRNSTLKVGCGFGICPVQDEDRGSAKIGLERHAFVVCLYGNSKYEEGYKLYTEGKYCDNCKQQQTCRKQLCISKQRGYS